MKTKIGTTFGLALMLALGILATMLVLASFSLVPSKVKANVTDVIFEPSDFDVNDGASWTVTFTLDQPLAAGSDTITLVFPDGVVLPDTIDKARIRVGEDEEDKNPLLSDPAVSGSEVILTLPVFRPNGDLVEALIAGDGVVVSIDLAAGILNPPGAGDTGGATVKTTAETVPVDAADVTFNGVIDVPGSAAEGDEVTVTVEGLTSGQGVTLTGAVTGSGLIDGDQIAVIVGTMGGASLAVTATDGAGATLISDVIDVDAALTVTATGNVQDTITLTGKNFTATSAVSGADTDGILFGGAQIEAANLVTTGFVPTKPHEDDDNDLIDDDFSIKIRIPSGSPAGITQVKVTDEAGASATANVEVLRSLATLNPSSGPPGTIVTVGASGLPASVDADNDNTIALLPVFGSDPVTGLFTTGSGGLPGSDTVTIPAGASGEITITITIVGEDDGDNTVTATFTVTSRGINVSPATGPRGTDLLVSGANFSPHGSIDANSIEVGGETTVHRQINLDTAGNIPATSVKVPANTPLGTQSVSATDDGDRSGSFSFIVTQPTIGLDPTVNSMGGTTRVTGVGWVSNSSVNVEIRQLNVIVSTAVVTTDANGGFDLDMEIPSSVGVGPGVISFTANDGGALGNTSLAASMTLGLAQLILSTGTAEVGDIVAATATGFIPNVGLSALTIGGASVLPREPIITDTAGGLTVSFKVPGLIGAQLVSANIGGTVRTISLIVERVEVDTTPPPVVAEPGPPVEVFAAVITADAGLQVWSFAGQQWRFFGASLPAALNSLVVVTPGDGAWLFNSTGNTITVIILGRSVTMSPGWNLKGLG
jgi:hypothetical protein